MPAKAILFGESGRRQRDCASIELSFVAPDLFDWAALEHGLLDSDRGRTDDDGQAIRERRPSSTTNDAWNAFDGENDQLNRRRRRRRPRCGENAREKSTTKRKTVVGGDASGCDRAAGSKLIERPRDRPDCAGRQAPLSARRLFRYRSTFNIVHGVGFTGFVLLRPPSAMDERPLVGRSGDKWNPPARRRRRQLDARARARSEFHQRVQLRRQESAGRVIPRLPLT
uniref:Uncharacterized protein n=1 Tax=Plectus sambesii TaxID=2011161 RepID=A0A914XEQ9_9BILA